MGSVLFFEGMQWGTVNIFDHLQHGGRMSVLQIIAETTLHIKPLLHVNENGKLAVMGKSHSRKWAVKVEQGWNPEIGKLIIIGHINNVEGANQLEENVIFQFSNVEIIISDIGPIIGAHTGPGMLTMIY